MGEPTNILEWALHWESTEPDRTLFTQPLGGSPDNVQSWTVREALDEARRMAAHLQSLELPPKSAVAICSKNCAHWVMADLAIWMAGHVSIPVYPTLTADTVRHILEHSEARLLFVGKLDPIWDQMRAGVPASLPTIAFPLAPEGEPNPWTDIIRQHEPLESPAVREKDELATIIYTSGSTGMPKGVMQSFGAIQTCTDGMVRLLSVTSSDRYLSYLPLSHGMERWLGECITLRTCAHVFYAESPETFVVDLRRARPTLFLSVPRLWLKFQRGVFENISPTKLALLLRIPLIRGVIARKILGKLGLDAVRFAGSGSAPLPADLMAWYRALGLELLEGYGMTENFNYSHLTRPGQVRPGHVGTPYDDVEFRLGDDGEVLVKSPGAMMGYYKLPDETREAFTEDGFLHTGDRGVVDAEGRLKLTGRTKELFKTSKGKYVAPVPIENRLSNHPRIEQCCVSGAGHPQPHALVVLSDAARADVDRGDRATVDRELTAHVEAVNEGLDPHERLAFVAVVREVWAPENELLTPTMKIRRRQIEGRYAALADEWYAAGTRVVWEA